MRFEADILGLPGLLVKARLEIRVSSGSCYLRLSLVEGALFSFPIRLILPASSSRLLSAESRLRLRRS
jgi:hypothetical protein